MMILSVQQVLNVRGARRGLLLPVGPEANHYWRRGKHGQIYRSAEGLAWSETVWASALQQTRNAPRPWFGKDTALWVTLFWYREAARGDLDNRLKPLLDALQRVAYDNDRQVSRITAERIDGVRIEGYPNGCFHVIVEEHEQAR